MDAGRHADRLVIIDTHLLDQKALGAEGSLVRTTLGTTRDDVKKATGIDLAFDVDKLLLSPSLAVARGRFDAKKLADRLADHRYTAAEHKGVGYLVRAGEDAIAVIDGSVLLYGDAQGIEAAIDAHEAGSSLEKNDQLTSRLRRVGWDHPGGRDRAHDRRQAEPAPDPGGRERAAGGERGADDPRGARRGRGRRVGLGGQRGGAAQAAGGEARERRRDRAHASGLELAPILVGAAKRRRPSWSDGASGASGGVNVHLHLDPAEVDTLVKAARNSKPLAETYKAMRLFQLLVPPG